MLNIQQNLSQKLSQNLMLTQKMQQAIQILQLSGLELEQYVQQELETNPVLEQQRPEREEALQVQEKREDGPVDESGQFDDASFDLDAYTDKLTHHYSEGTDFSRNLDLAERHEYYQNSITQGESLRSVLMNQLQLAYEDEKMFSIGESIVGEVDEKGYFRGSIEDIANDEGVDPATVEKVLYRMQRFEPVGVCARDIEECLLLQVQSTYPNEPQLITLIEEHLEDLEKRQIPKIAKAMNITPERVEALKEMLSRLNPWPGYEYSPEATQYVVPDVIVEKNEDDELEVYLSDGSSPRLAIDNEYSHRVKEKGIPKEEKAYLREKLEAAKWLIRNIEQRQQTILRIGKAIAEVQHDFMLKGQAELRPLTLQEIATMVGVHEATVSRTTRGKYMQTPQGLYEMKYFFSPGLSTDNGEAESSKAVMSMIQKLVDEENKAKPLSDQKIADTLKKEGINIARRTVAKYRDQMGIPKTTMRKEYAKAK